MFPSSKVYLKEILAILVSVIIVSLYFKAILFYSICRTIDDEAFTRKGLKSTEITTSMSHILPPGILISCLSTRTKFLCFKKNLRDSLNLWQEITLNVPGKYKYKIQFL